MKRSDQTIENTITCPVCNGTGSLKETYVYKSRHKYDAGAQSLPNSEPCWFCGGEKGGLITQQQYDEWHVFETYPTCPLCNGTGGRRYWSWREDAEGSHKEFAFTPCRLCEGKRKVA